MCVEAQALPPMPEILRGKLLTGLQPIYGLKCMMGEPDENRSRRESQFEVSPMRYRYRYVSRS